MKKRIRHLTTLLLVVALLLPLVSLAQDDLRLDPNVAPTFEAIELHLDARQTEYRGSVRIELQVKAATSSFRFHAEEMTLERVELRDARGAVVEVKTQAGKEGLILATTGRELAPGDYGLAIDFSNDYNTRSVGLYRMEQDGVGYLFTQFEAVDAREAFPCWDEPSFKIPFQITIHIPEGQEAITNTPVASQTVSNGTKTLVYRKTRPLPSYLLAIAAGPLESVPITGLSVPGRVYTVKGQKQLAEIATEITPPILTGLEKYFARPYPYAKLDLIAIPEYWPGAMENAGAVTFADNILLIDPRAASPAQRRTLAYVTAHELAHMWFGDLVTMKWWDDLWLNESFADWLGEKIANDLFPQYKISVDAVQNLQGLMNSDARPSTKPIKKTVVSAADIFEDLGLAYGKGKKVLGMVEQWIGPEVFRKGVIDYLGQHAWGNAEAADLWGALSKTSGKDVAAPLLSFFTQPGYPMVSVAVETDGILKISQQRFLNFGVKAPALQWTLPLRLKYSDGKSVQTQTVLLDRATKSVRVGKNLAWVLPDGGAYGYYRWSIPKEMLFRLAQNPEKRLNERERVAFLGNASALLDAGAIGGDDYLTILGSFAKYPEPEIISAVLADLGRIRNAFIPDDLRTQFAYYVRETLRPALERFGLKKKDGEAQAVSLLRPQLMAWLGKEGQSEAVRRYADSLATSYLADPTSIDAALAGVALSVAAIEGDRQDFEAYKTHFEKAQVPAERQRYLAALGNFADVKLREAALNYAIAGPIRANELFTITGGMFSTTAGTDRVFRWLTENYEAITSRLPKEFVAFMPLFASGCSQARLKAARAFFVQPGHKVDGTNNYLAKVTDQVTDCVNLRQREGAAVAAYLNRLMSARQ